MVTSSVAKRWGGKDERDRLIEGEQILTAYSNGHPVSELAERWGYAPSTVHNRLKAAIAARISPVVDEYREVQNAVLDDQMLKLEEQLDAAMRLVALGTEQKDAGVIDRGMTQRLRAIEARTRILERRARLNGLDMPVKAEVSVSVTTPVDTAVSGLLAEMDAL
jgi:hypothetical protein